MQKCLFIVIHRNHTSRLFGLRQSHLMTKNQSRPYASIFPELLFLTFFPHSFCFLSDILPNLLFLSFFQSSCWRFSFQFHIVAFCRILSLFILESCPHSHSIPCEFIFKKLLVFKFPLTFLVSYSTLPVFFRIRYLSWFMSMFPLHMYVGM